MADFGLTLEDKEEIRSYLDLACRDMEASFLELPEHLWRKRVESESWSPAEIVEHVVLAQAAMKRRFRRHLGDALDLLAVGEVLAKRDLLYRVLPGKGKIRASEALASFRGLSQIEGREQLAAGRASLTQLLQDCDLFPIKAICWPHSLFGKLNGYLWLLYMPLHAERHSRQLRARTATLLGGD